MTAEVSPEVRAFLKANVMTHEHVEVLLLIAGDAQPWTAQEAAEQLNLPLEIAEEAMTHLWRVKLLEARSMPSRRSGFAYAPGSPEVSACVGALAAEYAANRFAIVQLLGTLAIERLRNAAIHHFADAFVLKAKARKDG